MECLVRLGGGFFEKKGHSTFSVCPWRPGPDRALQADMDEVSVGLDEAWKQRLAGQIDRAREWPLPAGQFFEGPGGGDLSVPDGTSPGRGVFVIHREDDAPVQDQVSLLGAHAGRLGARDLQRSQDEGHTHPGNRENSSPKEPSSIPEYYDIVRENVRLLAPGWTNPMIKSLPADCRGEPGGGIEL